MSGVLPHQVFYIMRHALTDKKKKEMTHLTDLPLNKEGYVQAYDAKMIVGELDPAPIFVVSSARERAIQTATIAAGEFPFYDDKRLNEDASEEAPPILREYMEKYSDGPILFVAHQQTIERVARDLGIAAPLTGNAEIVRFDPPGESNKKWQAAIISSVKKGIVRV